MVQESMAARDLGTDRGRQGRRHRGLRSALQQGGHDRDPDDRQLSGKVAYAALSFGGFLGIGERYHPLPWSVLRYSTELGGYVVDVDKKTLENAPTYGANEMPNYGDREWAQRLHDYYRAQVYWD